MKLVLMRQGSAQWAALGSKPTFWGAKSGKVRFFLLLFQIADLFSLSSFSSPPLGAHCMSQPFLFFILFPFLSAAFIS